MKKLYNITRFILFIIITINLWTRIFPLSVRYNIRSTSYRVTRRQGSAGPPGARGHRGHREIELGCCVGPPGARHIEGGPHW